jgi:hypothetical protein
MNAPVELALSLQRPLYGASASDPPSRRFALFKTLDGRTH